MSKSEQLTPVQELYKGKTIFITGGSGFMGKVLIEKLLYSCSDLKQIFLLIRPKKGKSPESRIEDMFKIPAFERIKEEKPEVMKKLVPIQGDVTFDKLGLSGEEMERVCRETNIVFHCAATLRLEANLKDALDMNTTGTKRVLDIAREMKHLLAFIHLSTAFCYCDQEVLLEKVYDCPHDPEDLIKIGQWMDVKVLEKITPELLHPHPNTYTYSKRLAEILVQNEYPNMPVCIARPSIVSPAWEEPCQGWVDSLNGPIGIMVGGAKGVIRTMLCNGEHRSEVVPVDIAINGLIAIAYKIATTQQKPINIPVFNVTCSDSKKVTWREVLDQGKELNYKYPFEGGVWYPGGDMTTSKLVHTLKLFFYQLLPAYLIDFIMLCIGQKRFMVRVQKRIYDGLEVLQFFTTRQWDFRTERFFGLYKELTPKDQHIFNMDTDGIPDLEYLKRSILGGRQYCLKEPLTTLPKARRQLKVLWTIDLIAKALFYGLILWAFWSYSGLKEYTNGLLSESNQGFLKQS